ncbi:hypothetical protein OF83DRAFT_1167693 [Amylostereum chailletii]|nr:hypothetical protein OF83DRAFT_1167693 [Amylostereum chailletii]
MSSSSFFYPFDDSTTTANKANNDFSFFEYTPSDVVAPPPESFDFDLDASLAAVDDPVQVFSFNHDIFSNIRDTPALYHTPSVFTASSDSYDTQTVSSVTASSFYNNPLPLSPPYSSSSYGAFPLLDMEFSNVRIGSDYGVAEGLPPRAYPGARHVHDPTSFGALPPSPPDSPRAHQLQRARSEYQPALPRHVPRISGAASNMSPDRVPTKLPTVPHVPAILSVEDGGDLGPIDSRRKHQCPNCPRAFARAFNLKTHMETHNPNRSKPYVCPHRSCNRSFSRKHDLQRHRAAIHHDQGSTSSTSPPAQAASLPVQPVGVQRGSRAWCESCGKGWVGQEKSCNCPT